MVDRYSCRRRDSESSHNHPSFSSTLLDAIYRSIDLGEEEMGVYRQVSPKKKKDDGEEMADFRRACMVEKWMEKKVKSMADDVQVKKSRKDRLMNSCSSSSDSSCGGGGGVFFSWSEAESFAVQRPKPVRTGGLEFRKEEKLGENRRDGRGFGDQFEQKSKHEGGSFLKTKSRALKIYGDLKKVKQPISPGGKLAGFLNSLFTAGNLKKSKIPGGGADDSSPSLKSTNASTCSSASSFSRSCLSKTPSSREKPSGGAKRSVRFFPVSVIVDEDCQPCGHKSLHQENNKNTINSIKTAIDEELLVHILDKNRRADEAAGDFLMNYQKKNEMGCEFELPFDHLRKSHFENQGFDPDFEEDDDLDAESYASSDLFELDNLSAIGMERYREELPVYETTHLDTNRAIANGLIL